MLVRPYYASAGKRESSGNRVSARKSISPACRNKPSLLRLLFSTASDACAIRQQDSLKDKVGAEGLASLNEYGLVAMRYVMSNGSVTAKALAGRTGKSASLCARTIKDLVEKGILKWHGSSKNDPSQHSRPDRDASSVY